MTFYCKDCGSAKTSVVEINTNDHLSMGKRQCIECKSFNWCVTTPNDIPNDTPKDTLTTGTSNIVIGVLASEHTPPKPGTVCVLCNKSGELIRPCNTAECLNRTHEKCLLDQLATFKKVNALPGNCRGCNKPIIERKIINKEGIYALTKDILLAFTLHLFLPLAVFILITGLTAVNTQMFPDFSDKGLNTLLGLMYAVTFLISFVTMLFTHLEGQRLTWKQFNQMFLKHIAFIGSAIIAIQLIGCSYVKSTMNIVTMMYGVIICAIFTCIVAMVYIIIGLIYLVVKSIIDENTTIEYGVKMPAVN